MNRVKLAFEIFKCESYKNRSDLRNKIKKVFKEFDDKILNELTLEIINYQVLVYGKNLIEFQNDDYDRINYNADARKRNKYR